MTSTGSNAVEPSSSGMRFGGNQRSHCAASPASQTRRSAGSGRRCSGRSRRTLSRNHVIDPIQPTRSAITVAGISGCSERITRTFASNGANAVGTTARSYFGGRSEASAWSTVARPIPNCRATCRRGTPSATSRLINAQSSTEITHPICLGGLVFDRRYCLVFKRRRHTSTASLQLDPAVVLSCEEATHISGRLLAEIARWHEAIRRQASTAA